MDFSKIDCRTNLDSVAQLTIAAGPVIIENSKVVLTMEDKDEFWKFPGGKVSEDESFLDTIKREAMEEAGLEIDIFGKPFIYLVLGDVPENSSDKYYLLVHYQAKVTKDLKVGNDKAIKQIKWFDISDLPKNIAPNIRPAIDFFSK